jgi:hypothetical protein
MYKCLLSLLLPSRAECLVGQIEMIQQTQQTKQT